MFPDHPDIAYIMRNGEYPHSYHADASEVCVSCGEIIGGHIYNDDAGNPLCKYCHDDMENYYDTL